MTQASESDRAGEPARTAERAGPLSPPDGSRSWQGLLSSRVANAVALVAFLVVGVSVFVAVHRFGVNMIYADQWSDVSLLRHAHDGTLTVGRLWAQHNENRILVPNLIVLLLGYTTHLQVLVEDYLSAAAICATAALVILAHRRRAPGTPWIAYVPVALVLLSGVTVVDAMFAFNLSWFLVLLALAVSVFLADRVTPTRLSLAGAVAAAAVGSVSSLQGLLIWPAVLVILWLRRRSPATLVAWIASAVVVGGIYLVNFDFSKSGTSSGPATGIGALLRFAVSEVGNVVGNQSTSAELAAVGALTLLAVAAAGIVGFRGWKRGSQDGRPVGAALMTFGLLFVAASAIGRANLGLGDAVRYAPFVLMVWIGAYFVLLSHVATAVGDTSPADGATNESERPIRSRSVIPRLAFFLLLAMMVIEGVLAGHAEIANARGWNSQELQVANVEANIDSAPRLVAESILEVYPVYPVRSLTEFARAQHLSLFATSLAAEQERKGLNPAFLNSVVRPYPGQTLSDKAVLDAGVRADGVTAVEFVVTGGGMVRAVVAQGHRTLYGYVGIWPTTTVPDGSYQIFSRVTTAGGQVLLSAPVDVVVRNRP